MEDLLDLLAELRPLARAQVLRGHVAFTQSVTWALAQSASLVLMYPVEARGNWVA